ncbi:MAG: GNAT family N-acetyltransferase [Nitrososphaera sp.]|nr:GNAT family N-acetyltransferase [Nitrososphaera sp.]
MDHEPVVRLTRPGDINSVTRMDLKCYPYPMPMQEWQERIKGSGEKDQARIIVVELYREPAGFAMWNINDEHVGFLCRLGVLPKYRRQKVGTLLMASCLKHCQENHCDKVKLVVPSIHCQPGDPDDVSAFLTACGFKTTKEILYNYCVMYGDQIDGYVFERGTHAITC